MTILEIWNILPEACLLSGFLIVLLLEILDENSTRTYHVTLLTLSLTSIILTLQCWYYPSSTYTWMGNYSLNGLSTIFRTMIAISSTLCLLISHKYLESSRSTLTEFFALLLTATLGAFCICAANDLVTLFVGVECLSLASYLLTGYSKRDIRSNEAAIKYLLMGGASSALLAYGFSWLYGLSGGYVNLIEIIAHLPQYTGPLTVLGLSLGCILIAVGFKLAVVPFHQWSPDVYEGSPTPIVSFFAVASKTSAFILTIRLLNLFSSINWLPLVSMLSLLTMIVGNLIGLTQTSMKRLLAYSSISQAGYLLIAILCSQDNGYTPLVVYLLTYIFMNMGAFACVIVLTLKTGTDQLRDYSGLYFRDPILATCLSICLLSLAGMPPFAGFFAKLYLFWCGWSNGLYLLVYVGLATSVISLYYYLRVIKMILTKEKSEQTEYIRFYPQLDSQFLPRNSLEVSIAICVFVSSTLGFVLNPIIGITDRLLASI